MPSFDDIHEAYTFVSGAPPCEHTATLRRSTGQIFLRAEMGDLDEISEAGLDDVDQGDLIEIPHKNDLDLGRELVFDFAAERMPDQVGRVQGIFSSRGAYARFKELLASQGLLDAWYEFESKREEEALRQWCADNNVSLTD